MAKSSLKHHWMAVAVLLLPNVTWAELRNRPPSGLQNSRDLEHYRNRLEKTSARAKARASRAADPAGQHSRAATVQRLEALRLHAGRMTEQTFTERKAETAIQPAVYFHDRIEPELEHQLQFRGRSVLVVEDRARRALLVPGTLVSSRDASSSNVAPLSPREQAPFKRQLQRSGFDGWRVIFW